MPPEVETHHTGGTRQYARDPPLPGLPPRSGEPVCDHDAELRGAIGGRLVARIDPYPVFGTEPQRFGVSHPYSLAVRAPGVAPVPGRERLEA